MKEVVNIDIVLYEIKSIYYNIKNGIKNLIKWVPAIWNDRDFDYTSIYSLLYYKFKHMEKVFNNENCYLANAKNRAKELNIAKNLCKRLAEEKYLENAAMWHDKKYEDIDFTELFKPHPTNKNLSVYVGDNDKQRDDSFKRCCIHAHYMKQRDKECLLKHINKYIEKWWD